MVFLTNKMEYWLECLFKNISRDDTNKGCVVASISKIEPPYYYHWTRDAGLIMLNLARIMLERDDLLTDRIRMKFIEYLNFEYECLCIKHECISGPGEAKYCVNATPFNEPWGRPQNDGPAIRIMGNLTIYELFKKEGLECVIHNLLLGAKNSIIINDIIYLLDNIGEECFDLWEEVKGHHFYTYMVQYHSLLKAKKYFETSINEFDVLFYESVQVRIDEKIEFLNNEINGMILNESVLSSKGNIEHYKREWLDTSIFLAILHTQDMRFIEHPCFQNSIYKMIMNFKDIYPINNENKFFWLGRYKEDVYYGGNPWILITIGFFEYVLRLKQEILKKDYIEITPLNIRFYKLFYKDSVIGKHDSKSSNFVNLNQALWRYCQKGFDWISKLEESQAEQIDRFSGEFISAENLTWNYSQILSYLFFYNKIISV